MGIPGFGSGMDNEDLIMAAQATMRDAKFPVLATAGADGHPHARPVSPVRTDGFTVYVANLRRYGKTEEIADNPRVELVYVTPGHDQVRIAALAEVVGDRALLDEIWEGNALLRKYLGTPENPELIVYRMVPQRVRFMREWALEYHEVGGG